MINPPSSRNPQLHWSRAWGGFVFGSIAVIALALIAFVVSAPGRHAPTAGGPLLLTPVPSLSDSSSLAPRLPSHSRTPSRTKTAAATSTSAAPSTTTIVHRAPVTPARTSPATTSAPPPPAQPVGPCSGADTCVVGGPGSVGPALDDFRRAHGADGGIAAVVTAAAQRCAATAGDGPTCAQPYAVVYEPQQDGGRAISDIAAGVGNWLLDPQLSAVEVGWAYQPRTRQYVCVLLERT